jgi:hypothetical protein
MKTEFNKNYILSGVTIVTLGIAFYSLFKYKKALPCSSIEEEIENEDDK